MKKTALILCILFLINSCKESKIDGYNLISDGVHLKLYSFEDNVKTYQKGDFIKATFFVYDEDTVKYLNYKYIPFLPTTKSFDNIFTLLSVGDSAELLVSKLIFDDNSFVDITSDVCIIPPNSFALARTVEYFRIPRNVLTICLGKSTYARCGIIVNVTPLEPEWEGHVTLEFSNTTNLPAKIYAGEGVAQMIFLESDEECEVSYKDRGGKYQGQTGVTLPKT